MKKPNGSKTDVEYETNRRTLLQVLFSFRINNARYYREAERKKYERCEIRCDKTF